MTSHLAQLVQTDLGVAPAYQHKPKRVTCGESLEPKGAALKWYGIHAESQPIPEEVTALARAKVMDGTLEARGLGFVLLHRCGASFYFLIICTWRGENELWQTVLYKDESMSQFASWPREQAHKPTLCVWELVPVLFEQQAWVRFLTSARDEAAARKWLGERFEGPA